MIEVAFSLLTQLASSIVSDLFSSVISDKIKGSIVGLRAQNAQNRAITRLIESMEPFFSSELTPEDSLFLASNLQSRFSQVKLSPTLLAQHRFSLDTLAATIITKDAHHHAGAPPHLVALLDDMTREALVVARALADIVPEWEGAAWRENFKAFDELRAKLDKQNEFLKTVLDDPTNRMNSLEAEYRRYVISELQRVYLKGIGNIGDTRALSIDSLFTQVRVKLALASQQGQGAEMAEVATRGSSVRDITPNDPIEIEAALASARRMVIMGAPGAGKSTIVQFIALRAALGEGFFSTEDEKAPVPFLLRVRSFKNFHCLPTPKDMVAMCAPLLDRSDAGDFVAEMLRRGRALLIVDGLDECEIVDRGRADVGGEPSSERDQVVRWLERLSDTYPDARLITTTRPVGYTRGELEKAGFREFEIMPLTETQQEQFIERWCQAVELSLNPDDPTAALLRGDMVATDLKRRIASARSVRALAYNPLMLSVICILHRYRGERLPERRVDLLNDCVNVLLYDFRSASGLKKSIIGDLDAKELRSLLEPLAWHMALNGVDQASEDTLRELFAKHLPEIGQPESRASEIIATIRDRTGVIVENGPRSYSFMHLLFQEYLAAEECASRADNYDVLLSKVADPRWKEIIPMAIAASSTNKETLLRSLLQVGAVPLAASAMAMIDRAPIGIRRAISEALSQYSDALVDNFDKELLSRIMAIGTADSTATVLRVVASLPILTSDQVRQAAIDFNYEKGTIDLSELAERTARRALTWSEFSLGGSWDNLRDIGYELPTPDVPRAGSWLSISLAVIDDPGDDRLGLGDKADSLGQNHLWRDALYNYAVMLDTGDTYRGNFVGVIWEAFESLTADTFSSIELRLLTLHFVWYFSSPEENIDNLLDCLDRIPPDKCPGFQLGILNNAMHQLGPSRPGHIRDRAEARWWLALDEAEKQICGLFPAWKEYFQNEEGQSEPSAAEVLSDRFCCLLREKIAKSEIFSRTV